MSDVTEEQIDDMLHALGQSQTPLRKDMGWRNYYAAGDAEIPSWEDLVKKGYALKRFGPATHSLIYYVSPAGMAALGVTKK